MRPPQEACHRASASGIPCLNQIFRPPGRPEKNLASASCLTGESRETNLSWDGSPQGAPGTWLLSPESPVMDRGGGRHFPCYPLHSCHKADTGQGGGEDWFTSERTCMVLASGSSWGRPLPAGSPMPQWSIPGRFTDAGSERIQTRPANSSSWVSWVRKLRNNELSPPCGPTVGQVLEDIMMPVSSGLKCELFNFNPMPACFRGLFPLLCLQL